MTRPERGHATVEMVLLAPALMVVLLLVVGLGRMAHARAQVESVAADAARAASLERNPSLASATATQAAQRSLGGADMSCAGLHVATDLGHYTPGGEITVTVSCKADLSDVALAGFPGQRLFTASATVPIETWRSQ